MNQYNLKFLHMVMQVFWWHLLFVSLTCLFIVLCKFSNSGPFEAPFLWAIFLLMDFPTSIIVFFTGGIAVVEIPEVFVKYWIIRDVLWPGLVFQIIGTLNWGVVVLIWCIGARRCL